MVAVVYLVWGPLGPAPVREFVESYKRHPAGAEHELVVLFNGVQRGRRTELEAELSAIEHRLIELPAPVMDLTAYGHAARVLGHRQICFLNSYSRILAARWLDLLAHAASDPQVGIAGATGSWESRAELVPGGLEHWLYQLTWLPHKRRVFQRFPNPHIRTTAFMLERELVSELGLERVRNKRQAHELESGKHGITKQILARGLRAVVVGRDGNTYEPDEWQRAGTYRSGVQRNLLVADNRTAEWQNAPPAEQEKLTLWAWEKRR